MDILIGILGLAVLMIVHETGHFLVARAFGMRVLTFSIGFGPTFFKIQPHDGYYWFTSFGGKLRLRLHRYKVRAPHANDGSAAEPEHLPTVYQVAMIPFLAYVQIAGMNPLEEHDPKDKGSYANASLFARICTIFAGPLANYLFASVFFFFSFYYGGRIVPVENQEPVVEVIADNPAAAAAMHDGDRVVKVDGVAVTDWDAMATEIRKHPAEQIPVVVLRGEVEVELLVTPADEKGQGKIGVRAVPVREAVNFGDSLLLSVQKPPEVVKELFVGLGAWISGDAKVDVGGPGMIVKEMAAAVKRSFWDLLQLLGALSAYLGAFNLFPFPALDGGRLMFLGYELATRRRPNAKVEARIHIVGFVMLLGLMLYVTIFKDLGLGK